MDRVPIRYREVQAFILEHRLLKHVITIQRYVRKQNMKAWLKDHAIAAQSETIKKKDTVKIDVSFLESHSESN